MEAFRSGGPAEAVDEAGSVRRDAGPQGVVLQDALQRLGHLVGLAAADERGLTVDRVVVRSAVRSGDERATAGHRLDRAHPESFLPLGWR